MANLGDLYYTFRGDGKKLKADAKKEGEAAGTVAGQGFAARMKSGVGKAFGGAKGGLLAGLGLGAGLGAIGLATSALSKMTDVMGDAVQAAIEEEASISKLDAALRANVDGYEGNTDAIEETLAARMRLGFADDEQRESLALAVAATHDETEALKLQRTAMDLARFKRISLKEATEALIKVEGGQFRILKTLGIQLPKNATATEALAAVQAVAAGQAEAFAETSEGRLLSSQIKVGEALEKLGGRALPFFAAGVEGAAEVVETLVLGLDGLGDVLDIVSSGQLPKTEEEAFALTDALLGLASLLPGLTGQAARFGQETADEMRLAAEATSYMADASKDDLRDTGVEFDALAEEGEGMADRIDIATGEVITSVEDLKNAVIGYARDIVSQAYDILDDRAELSAINVEKAELRKVIATGNATDAQKEEYRELTERQQELILDLAENGQLTVKEVDAAIDQLTEDLKTANREERRSIQATIEALQRLRTMWRNARTSVLGYSSAVRNLPGGNVGGKVTGVPHRAVGGSVTAGQPYLVNERTTNSELFVPSTSGRILTHAQAMQAASVSATPSGGGGGDTTINIPVQGALPVRTIDAIPRALRRAERIGVLPSRMASPSYRVPVGDR